MDEPLSSQGGVVMGDSPPTPPAQQPPAPPAESPQAPPSEQPFVVSAPSPGVNPFIPQASPPQAGLSGGDPPQDPPVAVPSRPGNPLSKIILLVGGIFAVGVLLFVAARFILGRAGGGGAVTLNYWGLWENDATMAQIITDFEADHPNITIMYTKQSQRQYRERLQAAIARGDGPDVFRFHNTWVPMLRNELASAPSDMFPASEFATTFYPVASSDLIGGQTVFGVPLMIDGLGLFYNEDLFASAGVTPPATWEDMLNIMPKLTVRNENTILTSAVALGTTGNIENFSDILATMMMQNGARLSVPSGKQAEEALIFYRKFADPADPVYTWNETMDNSIYAFASGKVAMIIAPSWRVFEVKQMNSELRFKVAPIPQLPGNTVTWASYWAEGVSLKSSNQAAAWEFLKYFSSQEALSKFYSEASKTRLFGEPYMRVDMADAIAEDPYVGAYIKQAMTAKSFPLASRTFDNGINDRLIKYMEDAVNAVSQGTAPTAALETATAGFRQVLGSYGLTTGSAPTTTP